MAVARGIKENSNYLGTEKTQLQPLILGKPIEKDQAKDSSLVLPEKINDPRRIEISRLSKLGIIGRLKEQVWDVVVDTGYKTAEFLSLAGLSLGTIPYLIRDSKSARVYQAEQILKIQEYFDKNAPQGSIITAGFGESIFDPLKAGLSVGMCISTAVLGVATGLIGFIREEGTRFVLSIKEGKKLSYEEFREKEDNSFSLRLIRDTYSLGVFCVSLLITVGRNGNLAGCKSIAEESSKTALKLANTKNFKWLSNIFDKANKGKLYLDKNPGLAMTLNSFGMSGTAALGEQLLACNNLNEFDFEKLRSDTIQGAAFSGVFMAGMKVTGSAYVYTKSGVSMNQIARAESLEKLGEQSLLKYSTASLKWKAASGFLDSGDGGLDVIEVLEERKRITEVGKIRKSIGWLLKFFSAAYDMKDAGGVFGDFGAKKAKSRAEQLAADHFPEKEEMVETPAAVDEPQFKKTLNQLYENNDAVSFVAYLSEKDVIINGEVRKGIKGIAHSRSVIIGTFCADKTEEFIKKVFSSLLAENLFRDAEVLFRKFNKEGSNGWEELFKNHIVILLEEHPETAYARLLLCRESFLKKSYFPGDQRISKALKGYIKKLSQSDSSVLNGQAIDLDFLISSLGVSPEELNDIEIRTCLYLIAEKTNNANTRELTLGLKDRMSQNDIFRRRIPEFIAHLLQDKKVEEIFALNSFSHLSKPTKSDFVALVYEELLKLGFFNMAKSLLEQQNDSVDQNRILEIQRSTYFKFLKQGKTELAKELYRSSEDLQTFPLSEHYRDCITQGIFELVARKEASELLSFLRFVEGIGIGAKTICTSEVIEALGELLTYKINELQGRDTESLYYLIVELDVAKEVFKKNKVSAAVQRVKRRLNENPEISLNDKYSLLFVINFITIHENPSFNSEENKSRLDELEVASCILRHGGPFDLPRFASAIGAMAEHLTSANMDYYAYIAEVGNYVNVLDRISHYMHYFQTLNNIHGVSQDLCREVSSVTEKLYHEYITQLKKLRVFNESQETKAAKIRYGRGTWSSIRDSIDQSIRQMQLPLFLLCKNPSAQMDIINIRDIDRNYLVKKLRLDNKVANVRIEPQFEDNLPLIIGDKAEIEVAVERLVSNALEAARIVDSELSQKIREHDGEKTEFSTDVIKVQIKSSEDRNSLLIEISNPGYISEEQIAKILQLDHFRRGLSHGVGLNFAKKVIERHGGTITIRNEVVAGENRVVAQICIPTLESKLTAENKIFSMDVYYKLSAEKRRSYLEGETVVRNGVPYLIENIARASVKEKILEELLISSFLEEAKEFDEPMGGFRVTRAARAAYLEHLGCGRFEIADSISDYYGFNIHEIEPEMLANALAKSCYAKLQHQIIQNLSNEQRQCFARVAYKECLKRNYLLGSNKVAEEFQINQEEQDRLFMEAFQEVIEDANSVPAYASLEKVLALFFNNPRIDIRALEDQDLFKKILITRIENEENKNHRLLFWALANKLNIQFEEKVKDAWREKEKKQFIEFCEEGNYDIWNSYFFLEALSNNDGFLVSDTLLTALDTILKNENVDEQVKVYISFLKERSLSKKEIANESNISDAETISFLQRIEASLCIMHHGGPLNISSSSSLIVSLHRTLRRAYGLENIKTFTKSKNLDDLLLCITSCRKYLSDQHLSKYLVNYLKNTCLDIYSTTISELGQILVQVSSLPEVLNEEDSKKREELVEACNTLKSQMIALLSLLSENLEKSTIEVKSLVEKSRVKKLRDTQSTIIVKPNVIIETDNIAVQVQQDLADIAVGQVVLSELNPQIAGVYELIKLALDRISSNVSDQILKTMDPNSISEEQVIDTLEVKIKRINNQRQVQIDFINDGEISAEQAKKIVELDPNRSDLFHHIGLPFARMAVEKMGGSLEVLANEILGKVVVRVILDSAEWAEAKRYYKACIEYAEFAAAQETVDQRQITANEIDQLKWELFQELINGNETIADFQIECLKFLLKNDGLKNNFQANIEALGQALKRKLLDFQDRDLNMLYNFLLDNGIELTAEERASLITKFQKKLYEACIEGEESFALEYFLFLGRLDSNNSFLHSKDLREAVSYTLERVGVHPLSYPRQIQVFGFIDRVIVNGLINKDQDTRITKSNFDRLEASIAIIAHGGPCDIASVLSKFFNLKKKCKNLGLPQLDIDVAEGYRNITYRKRVFEILPQARIRTELSAKVFGDLVQDTLQDFQLTIDALKEAMNYLEVHHDAICAHHNKDHSEILTEAPKTIEFLEAIKALLDVNVLKNSIVPVDLAELSSVLEGKRLRDGSQTLRIRPNVIVNCENPTALCHPGLTKFAIARAVSNACDVILAKVDPDIIPNEVNLNNLEVMISDSSDGKFKVIEILNPGELTAEQLQNITKLDPERPEFSHHVGLPAARLGIEAQNGTLEVFNDQVRKRVVVRIKLPIFGSR